MILNSAFAVDIYIMNEYNLKITGVKGNIEMIDIIDIGINYIIEMTVVWQYFRSFYSAKRSKQTEHVFYDKCICYFVWTVLATDIMVKCC